jgi:hypothetical protein
MGVRWKLRDIVQQSIITLLLTETAHGDKANTSAAASQGGNGRCSQDGFVHRIGQDNHTISVDSVVVLQLIDQVFGGANDAIGASIENAI